MNDRAHFLNSIILAILAIVFSTATGVAANQIVRDAEYYILEAQNGEKWKAEDSQLDRKLAELKKLLAKPSRWISRSKVGSIFAFYLWSAWKPMT